MKIPYLASLKIFLIRSIITPGRKYETYCITSLIKWQKLVELYKEFSSILKINNASLTKYISLNVQMDIKKIVVMIDLGEEEVSTRRYFLKDIQVDQVVHRPRRDKAIFADTRRNNVEDLQR